MGALPAPFNEPCALEATRPPQNRNYCTFGPHIWQFPAPVAASCGLLSLKAASVSVTPQELENVNFSLF
jgi:hypothetical protein